MVMMPVNGYVAKSPDPYLCTRQTIVQQSGMLAEGVCFHFINVSLHGSLCSQQLLLFQTIATQFRPAPPLLNCSWGRGRQYWQSVAELAHWSAFPPAPHTENLITSSIQLNVLFINDGDSSSLSWYLYSIVPERARGPRSITFRTICPEQLKTADSDMPAHYQIARSLGSTTAGCTQSDVRYSITNSAALNCNDMYQE